MTRFATSFISSIDGTSSEISTKELCGGARIYYIFNSVFGNSLETIDPTHNLSVSDIRTAIRNSTGPRPSLFVPELAFDLLVKPQIKLLEIPSQRCVELVYEELIKICHTCGSQELSRFPRLQGKLIEVVSDLLRERLGPASGYVESLISIQRAYINTNHPNFLGAAAAMSSVIQSKNEKEKAAAMAEERRRKDALRRKQVGVNGTATPEDDDAVEEKMQTLPSRSSAAARAPRSMSPAVARTRENGQSFSHGAPRDSFLNYFFGKDGTGMSQGPLPQPSSATTRHVSHSVEPSISQSIRRPDHSMDLARSPRAVAPLPSFGADEYYPPSEYGGDMNPLFVGSLCSSFVVRANILQPGDPTEPTLTERETLETELIQRLISSYFNIVRESIADQVPKAIMHLLVNHSRDEVQNRLVSELYKEDLFNDLLYEDDGIKKEREKCEKLLTTYKEAAKIVGEVL